jgi:hypothetical protein
MIWDGEAMVPVRRARQLAATQYEVGTVYPLVVHQDRSRASHDHYFACIKEAWLQLPHPMSAQFPDAHVLRSHALIKAGYYHERTAVFSSHADAQRALAFAKPIKGTNYSIYSVDGCVLHEFTARSQSKAAMGNQEFQQSKQDVLEVLAEMVGITADELASNAQKAA